MLTLPSKQMSTWPPITTEDYLAHVRGATARIAAAVESGPLDAPVAACPDWDLRALAAHIGSVHRWAERAAATAARPEGGLDRDPPADADATGLSRWLRSGAAKLVATLRILDPAAPTWHPFPVERVAAVWPRRQAHETVIHAWDAEAAIAMTPRPIDRPLAVDGIEEYFEIAVPRLVDRDGVTIPSGTLAIHCTDTGQGWLVAARDDAVSIERIDDAEADATLAGSAAGVLGRFWNRPFDDADVAIEGDEAVAAAWLTLPGM